jgi:hypothetical protein
MWRLAKRWLPYPRVYHRCPEHHYEVMTQGKSPVR